MAVRAGKVAVPRIHVVRMDTSQVRIDAQEFLDALPVPAWTADGEGRVSTTNLRLRELLGANASWLDALCPKNAEQIQQAWAAAVEAGAAFHTRTFLVTASGAHLPFVVEARPVRNHAGEVIAWSGTVLAAPQEANGQRLAAASRTSPADDPVLRDREATLQLALDAGELGVWTLDTAGRRFSFDERCQRVFGMPAETSARAVLQRVHPDDRESVEAALKASVRGASDYDIYHRLLLPDGDIRWLHVVGQVQSAAEQRAARSGRLRSYRRRVVGVVRDITAQMETAKTLRESEARFRQLADAMPQLVWTAQPDGTIDYYNNRRQEYDGFHWSGQAWEWAPVLHPDDREPTVQAWQHALEAGEIYAIEHRVRMADGSFRWHLSRGIPAQDDAGRVVKWYGTATDVHDLKASQEALRQLTETLEMSVADRTAELERINRELRSTRDHFQKAFHASPIAGCITRREDGLLIDLNAEYARFFGYAREEALGRTTVELGLWAEPAERPTLFGAWLEEGSVRDAEVLARTRSGEVRTVLVSIEPIDRDGVPCALTMFVDITERKRAEEAVRHLASALALAEQRERQRLALILHDDLQQILFGAELQLAILQHALPSERAVLSDQAETVRKHLKRGIAMTRTIALDLNPPILRGEGLVAALTWLGRHVGDVHGLQVDVEAEGEVDLPGEEHRVLAVQLVRELLFNVVKHAGVDHARIVVRRRSDHVVITVEDEGRGFDVQEVLDDQVHRTGLGLFSVEERLQLIGGKLAVDAAPGAGSRVEIEMPAWTKTS